MNIKDLMLTNNFVEEIESLKRKKKIEYIEAIVLWSEENKLEIETVATWVKKDPVMKARIQFEAENLNYMKKGARLPI